MNFALLQNSLLTAALATLLAMAFGLMAALWLAGLEARWRWRGLAAGVAAFSLPPFLVVNSWLHYLGHAGVWHQWLPFNLFNLGGAVWILALLNWPVTLLAVSGAWRRLEAEQLESDPALTGLALIRHLLLPIARGALTQAAVISFVLVLNNFSVPAILQVKVFPAEVWVLFNTTFDSLAALKISWPLIVAPLLLVIWLRREDIRWPSVTGSVSARVFRRQLGAGWFYGCGVGTVALVMLSVGLPLAQLASSSRTWTELPGALAAGQLAVENSLLFAGASATVCLAIGLLSRRFAWGTFLWLPFFVPGVLLGIGWIFLFNRPLLAGFYQHAGIVIFAFVVRYLAVSWNGAGAALRATDRDLADIARMEGATRWQMFRQVYWPQVSPQILALWYIVFLLCLWDVESMVLITPPAGETLALRVFNLLHYGHNAQVNSLCLALLALALLPPVLWWLGVRAGKLLRVTLPLLLIPLLLASCSVDNSREKNVDSKFFSKVQIIGSRGTGVGEFNKPRSVAVDKQDNLYVVDMTGRVQKFSPEGKHLLSWQMPQTDLGKPKGMGRDKDGNIIVVEPHYQRVNIFSPQGKLLTQWGRHGTNAGEFIMPRAVGVDSKGNFFVPEYTIVDRVQKFSAQDKKMIQAFGHTGTGQGELNRPEGLCVDESDRVCVADSCNHRIQIFDGQGKWLLTYGHAGGGPGELSYPYDICADHAGRQYVCEFGNSRVQVFDAQGKSLEVIGGPGGAPGQFSNPWGVALDSAGNLYVADSQNHRVQKFLRRKDVVTR